MRTIKNSLITLVLTLSMALPAFSQGVPNSFSDVVKKTSDSVVNISTTKLVTRQASPFMNDDFFRYFFGDPNFGGNQGQQRQYKTSSLGTGFIIDRAGFIVTNNHVIADADEIVIKFTDGKEAMAIVVGADPLTDLALLKVEPKGLNLKPIVLGDSDKAEIGDWVIAIGNPQGLSGTVTAGIISAKGRVLGDGPYDNFIQTDASINPGNSGGPLLNMNGEVVGVNTAILQASQGLGFAVPVNMLKDILERLKAGKVSRGWLGVTLQELNENLAKSFGLPADTQGVIVADVIAGDPADIAGIKAGDIIVGIDGKMVADSRELIKLIGAKAPKQRATLAILRDGKRMNIPVILGERPVEGGTSAPTQTPKQQDLPITTSPLTQEQMSALNITEGVVVDNVKEDTTAYTAGLRAGDIIVWFNRKPVNSPKSFYDMYNSVKKGEIIGLKVITQTGARFLAFNK